MEAFEGAVEKLQRELDSLKDTIRHRRMKDGNGPGNGGDDGNDEPPPAPPNPNLVITGAELTQGIQFFNFNGQGTGTAPDNSLALVEGKDTVIRVYVDRGSLPGFPMPSTITGRCTAFKKIGVGQVEAIDMPPINAPINAKSTALIDRTKANDTLNFRLDAWRCFGTVSVLIWVWDSAHSPGDPNWTNSFASEGFSTTLGFTTAFPFLFDTAINVHPILIQYTGPGTATPLGPPTVQSMASTLATFVPKVFPTSGISFDGTGDIVQFNGDLRTNSSSGCGAGWDALLDKLRKLRAATSGTSDIFVGILPSNVPLTGSPAIGCGSIGVAAGREFDSATMAEEIGHSYGRLHAPTAPTAILPPPAVPVCTVPGNVDPNYPTYGSCPSGSIGEVGFDTATGAVHDPKMTFDFMGHCPSFFEWVSPYTWQTTLLPILFSVRGTPQAEFSPAGPAGPAVESIVGESFLDGEFLLLYFRMFRDGGVEILPSFHVLGGSPTAGIGESGVAVELRAADGRVVGFHRCHLADPHFDREGPYLNLHAVIPWRPETHAITFLQEGRERQVVDVEDDAPQFTSPPKLERDGDRVELTWQVVQARDRRRRTNRVSYLVRYSNDAGKHWRCVDADLVEPTFAVDLRRLPGGDNCLFQIVASSTIRSVVAESSTLAVPVKPRRPYILSPEPGAVFRQGEPVVLQGAGLSADFPSAPLDELSWTSNVGGFLGYGPEVVTRTLSPGLHGIELGVADGLGGLARVSTLIRIQS
jgi:hypothetical protein